MAYWLVKQEPSTYSFTDLQQDGTTDWDGVRNYQARNNLQAMQVGDLLLFYHSVDQKAVVGVARVTKTAYPDPTAKPEEQDKWVAVEVAPVVAFPNPVELKTLKATPATQQMALIKQSRLSVCPVTEDEFNTVLALGNATLPS